MIEVKDLTYQLEENSGILFQNLSFLLEKGSFTTLVGPNGSGKSTLVKIILGLKKAKSEIKIEDIILNNQNLKKIRSIIGVVLENPEDMFVTETVVDEIAFHLEKKEKKEIKKIAAKIGIESLLECNLNALSDGAKTLVAFASVLAQKPKIIILDDILSTLDESTKKQILEILKEYNQKKKTTILNITHDLNDSLYGKDIIVLQNGRILLNGPKEEVLKQESKLKKAGLELPFLADLSIRLIYYGILDHIILDLNEMVNTIWK